MIKQGDCKINSKKFCHRGPWWWSSGHRAHLIFRQSEFKSRRSLQFFCRLEFEKKKINKKEAGVGPLKTILSSDLGQVVSVTDLRLGDPVNNSAIFLIFFV